MSFFIAGILPYIAIAMFLTGVSWRILRWSRSAVPFRIPTTSGQQKSLPWIKHGWIENPSSTAGVLARMTLEVLLFRSLFRNTRAELHRGPRVVYAEEKYLWLGALVFHWSLLLIVVRHLRFFLEPVPHFILFLQGLDGFFQVGAPAILVTDVAVLAALSYLLQRRLLNARMRYLSLLSDYVALVLLIGLAGTGTWLRYFARTDLLQVKELAIGLVTFSPRVPSSAGWLFYGHLLLASVLIAYLPFSKLMHMAGVFLSPTRNLANVNRVKRHVNPWDHPVKIHTFAEWEGEYRDKIKAAGLPLEGN